VAFLKQEKRVVDAFFPFGFLEESMTALLSPFIFVVGSYSFFFCFYRVLLHPYLIILSSSPFFFLRYYDSSLPQPRRTSPGTYDCLSLPLLLLPMPSPLMYHPTTFVFVTLFPLGILQSQEFLLCSLRPPRFIFGNPEAPFLIFPPPFSDILPKTTAFLLSTCPHVF